MAKRGDGYGSESQFLDYWAEQRALLDASILEAMGKPGQAFEWYYPAEADAAAREPEGLGFLPDVDVLKRWRAFWPHTGHQQSWDGVARLATDPNVEWVLIEERRRITQSSAPHPVVLQSTVAVSRSSLRCVQPNFTWGSIETSVGLDRSTSTPTDSPPCISSRA